MWLVWTGGNDRFWDTHHRSAASARSTSSRRSRRTRRCPTAATTASGFSASSTSPASRKATGPDPNRYGLWLDMRDPTCPPDPFADAKKYPGVQIGARGKTVPVGSYYGEPTGIVGLRLFPNPDFDEAARRKWDSERYYRDPDYYFSTRSREAVPRRHVVRLLSRRAESDEAAGRSGEPGVGEPQLERRRAVLLGGSHLQLAERQATGAASSTSCFTRRGPGTLDTSLVSTDNINNPRTMNAVYYLGPRMGLAKEVGQRNARRRRPEQQAVQRLRSGRRSAGAVLHRRRPRPGRRACSRTAPTRSARSARSIASTSTSACSARSGCSTSGRSSAGRKISPIEIAVRAEELRLLARHGDADAEHGAVLPPRRPSPHYLKDAPDSAKYPDRGRRDHQPRQGSVRGHAAPAATRASCPTCRPGSTSRTANGKNYLAAWDRYWAWTKTDEFKTPMRADRAGRRLPAGQLSVDRACASRPRCCRPTPAVRSPPMPSPATSGTTSRRSRTRSCRRSGRSACGIR